MGRSGGLAAAARRIVRQRGSRDRGIDEDGLITTGVAGSTWRASVTPCGDVIPWDGGAPVEWYVAASDRWYRPATEPALRQERIDGTAVVETRLRIPGGDVVHRVHSVADHGGLTVIEILNDSPAPIAVALTRPDLLTERPVADVPIEGIDLPAGTRALPIGHRSSVRVGLAHAAMTIERLPDRLPTWRQAANGWLAAAGRISELVLPDGALGSAAAQRVVAERCEILLAGPPSATTDPTGFILGAEELSRAGDDVDDRLDEVADAVARIARRPDWTVDRALEAAGRLLQRAGQHRAVADLDHLVLRRRAEVRTDTDPPAEIPAGPAAIVWTEVRLAHGAAILPGGFPASWLGRDFEAHGLVVGDGAERTARLSYAVRWHGARPAVLWEVTGGAVMLRAPVAAPGWSSDESSGEVLWPAPADGGGAEAR